MKRRIIALVAAGLMGLGVAGAATVAHADAHGLKGAHGLRVTSQAHGL